MLKIYLFIERNHAKNNLYAFAASNNHILFAILLRYSTEYIFYIQYKSTDV
jgi:hypothetical protein